tara:strand:- start:305 stop:790 length:486 start_codon:yes stop_codon:yes gene_type:complete
MVFIKITTMKKLLVITLLFASTIGFSQEKAKWYIDFEKAAQVSLQTGKPILADFTGSDWCGWCIKLKKEVFNTSQFRDWADQNVVLLELDYPRRKQQDEKIKKQNRELQQIFQVRGYPTIHIFNVKVNKENQLEFIPLGQSGYVAGGPTPWINKAKSILKK